MGAWLDIHGIVGAEERASLFELWTAMDEEWLKRQTEYIKSKRKVKHEPGRNDKDPPADH